MKTKKHFSVSRRETPWNDNEMITPSQAYIKTVYQNHYFQKHSPLLKSGEDTFLNNYAPDKCPVCGSLHFHKDGKTKNNIQRYRCKDCDKRFTVITGTIFEDHKLPVGEWIEYCLNLFHHVSLSSDSRNNKNALSTSVFWLHKLFLILNDYQDNFKLSGTVYLDETYYTVIRKNVVKKTNGSKPRGISRNKICIVTAMDDHHVYCSVCGYGKPSSRRMTKVLEGHIETDSTLIHDGESAHNSLICEYHLKEEIYTTKETKGLSDKDNPLYPINHLHFLLKNFLKAHSSFKRSDLTGYLNLFSFIMNPPDNDLEKVDYLLNSALKRVVKLKYRQYFSVKP